MATRKRKGPEIITKSPGAMEPMESDLGEAPTIEFTEAAGTGENADEIIVAAASVESTEFQEKAANLAFMEEEVTVQILDSPEKNAAPYFEIAVNGKSQIFHRNRQYTVKRYFVEGLARAKPINYTNEEYTTPDGIRSVRYPAHKGLRYPFAVVADSNPRGKSWLDHVLKQS